jgi:hypothetical protein
VYSDEDIAKVVALAKKARLTWKGTSPAKPARVPAKKRVAAPKPVAAKASVKKVASKKAPAKKAPAKKAAVKVSAKKATAR